MHYDLCVPATSYFDFHSDTRSDPQIDARHLLGSEDGAAQEFREVRGIQSTIGHDLTESEAVLVWQFGMTPMQRGYALRLYEVSADLRAPRN